jgi:ATP-dependent Zn protease
MMISMDDVQDIEMQQKWKNGFKNERHQHQHQHQQQHQQQQQQQQQQQRMKPQVRREDTSEISTVATIMVSLVVCLLFLGIIGIAAHYSTRGYYQGQMTSLSEYTDDKWWCYHCVGHRCASSCWAV